MDPLNQLHRLLVYVVLIVFVVLFYTAVIKMATNLSWRF